MPATPARIGFIQQEFRRVVSENASVKAQFGSLARQTDDPMETFFDDQDDALAMATARQQMLGVRRRRFRINVTGAGEVLDLDYISGAAPLVQNVDPDRSVNMVMLVSEIVIDLARNRAALTIWG